MSTPTVDVSGVGVISWNPSKPFLPSKLGRSLPLTKLGRRLPLTRPVNNFGDLLGPVVVSSEHRLRSLGVGAGQQTLAAVGSVLHLAPDGATVWGTGANGKVSDDDHAWRSLDVRAVRGPLTRDFLVTRGLPVPQVFGDPGLLVTRCFPHLMELREDPHHDVTEIPNLNDMATWPSSPNVLSPRRPLLACLERIARSRLVVGSSLHGIVVAEALGIPARLISSAAEKSFKYEDYYRGTGRSEHRAARSVTEAVRLGGEPPLRWQPDDLVAAFPDDLWS